MTQPSLEFVQFRPKEASEQNFDDLISLFEARFSERQPDDPLPPRSGSRVRLETLEENKFNHPHLYIVRNADSQAIGFGSIFITFPDAPNYNEEKHITYMDMYLQKDWRGQGIGKQMLQFLVDQCKEHGITVIEGGTALTAGHGFLDHIGAKIGLTEIEVRVYCKDIDWQMVDEWVQQGQDRNPDTKIVYFQGLYSEDDVELSRFAEFETAIRADMPDGDLEGFTQVMTADKLREEMALEAKRGMISDYMLAVESDGRFSGFTRINYRADYGHKIEQRVTGVLRAERGRGLGKWLKARMLQHIKETYPDVEYINTASANVNDPMISINERIGFKEQHRLNFYSLSIETVQRYLHSQISE